MGLKESEIRPQQLFDKYIELSKKDGEGLDRKKFVSIECPGCSAKEGTLQFKKDNFSFLKCPRCNSLYCNPRPSPEQLHELYSTSESSKYWSTVFFPAVAQARREKLFAPKAKKIKDLLEQKVITPKKICDVGAGHGIFLEELRSIISNSSFHAIEPDPNSAEICRSKDFHVIENSVEKITNPDSHFDLVICSEVIEHVFDAHDFIKSLFKIVGHGGYCLMTGLGYEGFDILFLQEKSKSISPPHHLNFLSIEGFKKSFMDAGFSHVDIWTPGLLDVEIALNGGINNEFLSVLAKRGEQTRKELQQFLSDNQLSSHLWILAKKD